VSTRIVKAGLCLWREGKVLLARSKNDAHFQIPGGKIEAGESDQAALVREIREELSVEIDLATLQYLDTFVAAAAGRANVMVELRLYQAQILGEPRASSEIAELVWEAPNAPCAASSDAVRLHILPYLARRLI